MFEDIQDELRKEGKALVIKLIMKFCYQHLKRSLITL